MEENLEIKEVVEPIDETFIITTDKGFVYLDEEATEILNEERFLYKGHPWNISVYGNEGPIPHFHIKRTNESDICVALYEAKYFSHGVHTSTLSKKEVEELDKVLSNEFIDKSIPVKEGEKPVKITVWEHLVRMWHQYNNSSYAGPLIKPNYSKMKDTDLIGAKEDNSKKKDKK